MKSIATKLFLLIAVIVSITVLAMSLQSRSFFSEILHEVVEDQLKNDTNAKLQGIDELVSTYQLQLTTIMQITGGFTKSKKISDQITRKILNASKYFSGVVLQTGNKSRTVLREGLGSINGFNVVKEDLKSLSTKGRSHKGGQYIKYYPRLNLIAIPVWFDVKVGKTIEAVAALIVTADSFKKYLSNSDTSVQGVGFYKGSLMTGDTPWDTELGNHVRSLSDTASDAMQTEFAGRSYIVSSSISDRLGLTFYSVKDTETTFSAIDRVLTRSGLWGGFFVMISVLVSFFASSTITKKLRYLRDLTSEIAKGNFVRSDGRFAADEVGDLGRSVDYMSEQIQSLLMQTAEKARLEGEVKTAQIVQETFFPPQDISLDKIDIGSYYTPASECGGDWWGYYSVGNTDFVYIADAVGHGVSAALLTAMAFASFGTMEYESGISEEDSPGDILMKFNRVLYSATKAENSMTFLMMKINHDTKKITFANAGHTFPVLVPDSLEDDRLRKKKPYIKGGNKGIKNLSSSGMPLGMDPESVYEDKEISYKAKDKVFLYTDGIIECTNPEGEMYGKRRTLQNFVRHSEESTGEIRDKLVSESMAFFNGQEMDDDMTLVVLELKG